MTPTNDRLGRWPQHRRSECWLVDEHGQASLSWTAADGVFNLGYRYRRSLLEQVDLSFLYPINPTWSVVGRYYYSLYDDKALETMAGFQWDSCCVAVRLVGRRYVHNRAGDLSNSIMLEIELKGLGSAGQDTKRVLRRSILGYNRDDLYLVPPQTATGQPTPPDPNAAADTTP